MDIESNNRKSSLTEKELFLQAIEIVDLEERVSWLRSACGDDYELCSGVELLLASTSGGQDFEPDEKLLAQGLQEMANQATATTVPGEGISYFGDYELLDEVARGAMGVVFRANQKSLNRIVAIKMIRGSLLASEADVRRFKAEAEAAASLSHPNIVPIYEVGEHENQQYFSMKFVEGGTLADRMLDFGRDPRAAVALLQSVSLAVHEAHQHGILHRDLKPGNILLDEEGEPHVTDFGLAKQLGNESGLTVSGQIMGSPFYMAPEQAAGDTRLHSTASDIYSLGAILFELLAGQPPFNGGSVLETLRLAREEEVPRIASVAHSEWKADRDLETIVSKCLQKDPAARYGSAGALGDDFGAWLGGRPISARPVSTFERTSKWVKRKPIAAALLGVAVLFFLTLGVGGPLVALQQERLKDSALLAQARETDARSLAETRSATIRRNLYMAEMNLAGQALSQDAGVNAVQELTERWLPASSEEDLRGWEWFYLRAQTVRHESLFHEHKIDVADVTWSPDGQRLASCSFDRTIVVRDLGSQGAPLKIGPLPAPLSSLAFHPSAPIFATGEGAGGERAHPPASGAVRIFDLDTGETLKVIDTEKRAVHAVAWDPAGEWLATGQEKGVVTIHRWKTGEERLFRPGHKGNVYALAWSPDRKRLASVDQRLKLCVIDLEQGGEALFVRQESKELFEGNINSVDWSPDGHSLVTGGRNRRVHVWNAKTGEKIAILEGHAHWIWWVRWSPDGARIASGSSDHTIRIWDAKSFLCLGVISGHGGQVRSGAWHPDPKSNLLATGGRNGDVRIWDVWEAQASQTIEAHSETVTCLAWNSEGTRLASGSIDSLIKIWNPDTGHNTASLGGHRSSVTDLGWSSDGSSFVSCTSAGVSEVGLWNLESGVPKFLPFSSVLRSVAWHPNGEKFAVRDGNSIVVCDGKSGEVRHSYPHPSARSRVRVAWSPDGTRLAAGQDRLRIWDTDCHELLYDKPIPNALRFAWHPNGRELAIACRSGKILVMDPMSEEPPRVFSGHNGLVNSISWSPDGSRLASGGLDAVCRIWDWESGKLLLNLRGHTGEIEAVAWSPDGGRIASGGFDRTIKIWDARKGYAEQGSLPPQAR